MQPQKVSKQEVLKALQADDIAAKQLGSAAIPHLLSIVQGKDQLLASKAAFLAGVLDLPESEGVVRLASKSRAKSVRVAAAAAAGRLSCHGATEILEQLSQSSVKPVRDWAARSSHRRPR